MSVDQAGTPTPNPTQTDQPQPQGPQVALSNADDSRNGVSVANQAPAYGDPGQPAAPPASAPSTAQQHTGWFHGMMARMNQGDSVPVRDKNGNPVAGPDGKPQMQPLSSKQMGRSILAGVLSAMAATEQHQPYRNGNGIWVNPQNEAVQAGQQAFQAGRPKQQQAAAQAQVTQDRVRQYATYKANVDQFKMAHEVAGMKLEDTQKAVAGFSAVYDSAQRGEIEGTTPETLDVTGDDIPKLMANGQFDVTTHVAVPNGKVVPHLDANGQPVMGQSDVHYMILPGQNGKVTMTEGMIAAAGLPKTVKPGTQIPVTQWSDLMRKGASQHIVSSAVDQIAETLDIKDKKTGDPVTLDYSKFIKAARMTPDQLNEFQGLDRNDPVAYQAGVEKINKETNGQLQQALHDQGIDIDAKSWDDRRKERIKAEEAEAAAKIAEDKVSVNADAKANTPAGQADLRNKQLEIKIKEQQINQAAAQSAGLNIPKGFTPNPTAMALSPQDLQNDLQKQHVEIPPNFEALYAIGHNAADLKTYSSSPRKGVNIMPQATALAFIRQYINPGYQEGDYAAGQGLLKEIASTRQGTAGGSLLKAGTASNHLELLLQAATALHNNDVPALNHIANAVGTAVGKSPATVFRGISEFVNTEVGGVVAGGAPRETELALYRKSLNEDQSPQQTKGVVDAYIGLMAGRINEINDRNQQYFGRDVKGISPVVTKVFNAHGFAVGSQVTVIGKNGKPHIFNDQKAADGYKKAAGIQ